MGFGVAAGLGLADAWANPRSPVEEAVQRMEERARVGGQEAAAAAANAVHASPGLRRGIATRRLLASAAAGNAVVSAYCQLPFHVVDVIDADDISIHYTPTPATPTTTTSPQPPPSPALHLPPPEN